MGIRRVRAATLVIAGATLIAASASGQEGVRIIVNPQNPTSALSKAQLADLFLRKATTWEDGQPVLPVEQVDASPLRDAFAREMLGMSSSAAAQQVARRGGDPTPAVASDREVLAYVRLKPGAIGYVSASTPVQGVKTISVGGKASDTVTVSSREPIRVGPGGAVPPPAKVVNVPPEYPPAAKTARTEGTVELDILISPTGSVEDARVIKGFPLLSDAAIAAVRQWKYAPTVINGTAVPVRMVAKVAFVLHQ